MRRSHVSTGIPALLICLLLATLIPARQAAAANGITWDPVQRPLTQALQAPQPTSLTAEFTLINDLPAPGTATFSISFPDLPGGWSARVGTSNPFTLDNAKSTKIGIRLDIPDNATPGRRTITIRATRTSPGAAISEDAFLDLTLVAQVPAPVAQGVCPEPQDPGGDLDSAALIRVDKEEGHGICSTGDEDWYKFGALAGKYYTIDIPQMDKGLDLAIELYDENGNLLDANDDFPRSDTPSPDNARPRIKSFKSPASGYYFIRVRDTLGIGGANLGYRIVVNGESYGRNPPPVSSICNDIYEPDGLPEQAYTINPNETHTDHRLCPRADADWVKFFALAGYTYYLYTDSRDAEGKPSPGADPVLFVFNRDGQTLIDVNNNIAGGKTLDAALAFRPAADGIYFAQVKNVGDIGDTKIAYNLTLVACPPEQPECGPPDDFKPKPPAAPAAPPAAQPPSNPAAQPAPAGPPIFLDSEVPDRSAADLTPSAQLSEVKRASFVDPAFEQLWNRSDLPIASGRTARGWLWGPVVRLTRAENYVQATNGVRQVLYFDKGRMELTNTGARRGARWFVSSGLLVAELISGRVQIGDQEFTERAPADIPLVGDINDPSAPTYASLSGLAGRAADRTSQTPAATLSRDGQVGQYAGPARPETRLARYMPETGHNIPAVFWDYLNTRGVIYEGGYRTGMLLDWVVLVGYPISEPYWTHVRVGGVERDVLVQAFERRVLTYTPDEQAGWRVQVGNVGRHYYRWRYDEELPQ